MNWVRSNIKHGSLIALVALAIQFALSFGHFHGLAAQAAPAAQSVVPSSPLGHGGDQPSDEPCEICAVISLANAVLSAAPPLLALPQAIEFSYLNADTGPVHLNRARVAFQPRAPPNS
jgi:hypothetical protein